ncbi:MAG: cell division protein FtsL [Litoreibacter sp.]|nr:cell division protein FtsL [Litoreibacter sp.]
MMRGLLYATSALIVMGLAYWAYYENYKTQDALRDAARLQREIGEARETLSVLEAEWAYLNRPERLRDLADLNFETLQLLPISAHHFGEVEFVAYPKVAPDQSEDLIGELLLSQIIEQADVARQAAEARP